MFRRRQELELKQWQDTDEGRLGLDFYPTGQLRRKHLYRPDGSEHERWFEPDGRLSYTWPPETSPDPDSNGQPDPANLGRAVLALTNNP